jgi:hypothetical protein
MVMLSSESNAPTLESQKDSRSHNSSANEDTTSRTSSTTSDENPVNKNPGDSETRLHTGNTTPMSDTLDSILNLDTSLETSSMNDDPVAKSPSDLLAPLECTEQFIDKAKWPAWLAPSIAYLDAVSSAPEWKTIVRKLVTLEDTLGYPMASVRDSTCHSINLY